MEIVYRFYEPNQGLEEIQAHLYNQVTGEKATAEQIRARYETEKTNPKFVRYAFDENSEPLAYIQARKEKKSFAIGYPWALPSCPPEVQEKLFNEMLDYIKQKNPHEISYWLKSTWKDQISFFTSRGFVRQVEGFGYDFDVSAVSKLEIPDQTFTSRIASDDDFDLLLEIAKVDEDLKKVYTEEWFKNYFKDKVLPDGHCVLVFQDNLIVCASAPLKEWPDKTEADDYMILRFTATRPGYINAWKTLIIDVTRECVTTGWTEKPLRVFADSKTEVAGLLEELNPVKVPTYDKYVLKDDSMEK